MQKKIIEILWHIYGQEHHTTFNAFVTLTINITIFKEKL